MSSITTIESASTAKPSIAPWWHTVLVLLPTAALSLAGKYQHGLADAHIPGLHPRLSAYFTVMAAELLQVFLIWAALRRRGRSIAELIAGRWQTPASFFKDLGISLGFLVVAVPLSGFLMHLIGGEGIRNMSNFTPRTISELVVFLLLAITGGGFCEELIFRGYLVQQFQGWTGSWKLAVLFQGLVFGLGHGFYGKAMFVVMVHGWLLGLLARWRNNLRPGMLAHGLQDSIGGIAAFFS